MTVNDLAKPWPECLPRRFAPFLVHRSQYRSLTSGLPSFVPRPVEPSLHDVIVLADAAGLPAATIHGIDLAESCLDHPRRRSVARIVKLHASHYVSCPPLPWRNASLLCDLLPSLTGL